MLGEFHWVAAVLSREASIVASDRCEAELRGRDVQLVQSRRHDLVPLKRFMLGPLYVGEAAARQTLARFGREKFTS